jgi:hypothetical protein
MFRALPAGSVIEASPSRIVGLQRSMNTPAVALGGAGPVPSRAHVVGVYNKDGGYTLYVVLTPSDARGMAVFCSDPEHITLSNYRGMEQAALELVERHGFVMERVDVANLNPADRARVLRELPLGAPKPPGDLTQALADEAEGAGSRRRSREIEVRPSDEEPLILLTTSGVQPSRGSVENLRSMDILDSVPGMQAAGASASGMAGRSGPGGDVGMPPEEAIAVLGRLLAIF